jgi:acetyl esterase/lipase
MTHVIVLPGGGYWTHVESEGEPVAAWVRSATGLAANMFRYPLNRPHPEPLLALRTRVRELRGEGVEKVGLIGFSAGGHLAGQAALAPSSDPAERIDFAVLAYPVTSMELDTYKPSQDILLGPEPTALARHETSLENLVTAQAPPFFLWHTAEDVDVPAVHTYRLAAALNDHNVPHTVHVFPHGPHLLGLAAGVPDVELWTTLAAQWIIEYAHGGA